MCHQAAQHSWFHLQAEQFGQLSFYGSDARAILDLMEKDSELARPLTADLPYVGAEVIWAVRHEMARTVASHFSIDTAVGPGGS